MAAPEGAAHGYGFRTTWLPTGSVPHPFPPRHRKFLFEIQAADRAGGASVTAERLLNQNSEGCGQEEQASGAQPCRLVTMTSVVKTVYTLQTPSVLSGGLPSDTQTRTLSKSLLPVKSKEVDVSKLLPSGSSENDITKITKRRQENGQMKAADIAVRRNVRKSYKPLTKQKSEEALKDKNQLLEAVNKQLHKKLTETQGELKDLTQKVELLEKFQDNCLAILESKGLNPVLGSEVLALQQESTTDHMDSMLLLESLQDELKLFNETARKQMEELQALKAKLKMKDEERARFLEQQTLYNSQVNDFTTALEEMEQLLEM
ncbi:small kinetochore-associated protein isoform X2 [Manis pentadactyla]|uniref:small kinetochore-associated protein isoform X2 n=1 Tax=Manis pentadactyla TaxID=143292 RepID=UPI00255D1429|nr:small kinetochore-associated protein isoform X2 [Manis pentadactyla]KAI5278656.1 Small Kinetochore-Associated Protein [Manis pentadactyla]